MHTRFAVVFVVEIERENDGYLRLIPPNTRAGVVKNRRSLWLAEAVLLSVIIVKLVPKGDRAVHSV